MLEKCPICQTPMPPYESVASGMIPIDCKVCGDFRISEFVAARTYDYYLENRHLYSGAIRELNERGVNVVINDLDSLRDSVVVPDSPLERIDRIVLHIFRHTETYDTRVKLFDHDYSIAYAQNAREFKFLIDRAEELKYLTRTRNNDEDNCLLTVDGWRKLEELRKEEVKTNQAFVAMSFHPNLRSVYLDGIKPALSETGYVPLRVDELQFNEKIDDRIIADIRKSGLLIADFTQHKAGVYFEAGFAEGLGIEVIRTCRDDDIKNAHFDTRQYNHITWTDAQDLKEKLVARIEATVLLKVKNRRSD